LARFGTAAQAQAQRTANPNPKRRLCLRLPLFPPPLAQRSFPAPSSSRRRSPHRLRPPSSLRGRAAFVSQTVRYLHGRASLSLSLVLGFSCRLPVPRGRAASLSSVVAPPPCSATRQVTHAALPCAQGARELPRRRQWRKEMEVAPRLHFPSSVHGPRPPCLYLIGKPQQRLPQIRLRIIRPPLRMAPMVVLRSHQRRVQAQLL
jgi:hypothetical protein